MYITSSINGHYTSKGVLPVSDTLDAAIAQLHAFNERNGYTVYGEKDGDAYDAMAFKGDKAIQYTIEK